MTIYYVIIILCVPSQLLYLNADYLFRTDFQNTKVNHNLQNINIYITSTILYPHDHQINSFASSDFNTIQFKTKHTQHKIGRAHV